MKRLHIWLGVCISILLLFGCPGVGPEIIGQDSDGDGYSDEVELNTFLFDFENDPLFFNPFIADAPKIGIQFTSSPTISLIGEVSQGTSAATVFSWETSTGSEYRTTTSNSEATTRARELDITVGVEHEFGIDGGTTISGEIGRSWSNSQEVGFSYTTESMESRQEIYQQVQEYTIEEEKTLSGGKLSIGVRVYNAGDIAYTISSLSLNARVWNSQNPNRNEAGWNMLFDGDFQGWTLGAQSDAGYPNSMEGVFIADLTVEEALELLTNPDSIQVSLGGFGIVDENDRSFTHESTNIAAKTFTMVLDYGPDSAREPEIFQISDSSQYDSLDKILENIVAVPFVEGQTLLEDLDSYGLTNLRDVEADGTSGVWLISHTTSTDNTTRIYSPISAYSLADIHPTRRDRLVVFYVEDKDGDGLLAREEAIYGTSDNAVDTDGDGVGDYEEIASGSNPIGDEFSYTPQPPPVVNPPANVSDLMITLGAGNLGVLSWTPTNNNHQYLIVSSEYPISYQPPDNFAPSSITASQNIEIVSHGNMTTGYTHDNRSYNRHYYYEVFVYDPSTGKYSSGAKVDHHPGLQFTFRISNFEVWDSIDNGSRTDACEYLFHFDLRPGVGDTYGSVLMKLVDRVRYSERWTTSSQSRVQWPELYETSINRPYTVTLNGENYASDYEAMGSQTAYWIFYYMREADSTSETGAWDAKKTDVIMAAPYSRISYAQLAAGTDISGSVRRNAASDQNNVEVEWSLTFP